MPLYIKNGVKVDMLGVPTSAKVEYDTCHNRILKADETDTYKNDSSRLVGLDIEGCPVYECDGDYYSSTGERLPDDVYFESVDNSSFNR